MYYHSRNDINGERHEETGDVRYPEIMNRSELAQYLRLDEVSKAKNYDNVIINLQRMRDLPALQICRQPLYCKPSIREWRRDQIEKGGNRA
jgi:hypothetical protein